VQIGDIVEVTLTPEEGFGEPQPELLCVENIDSVPEEFRYIGALAEFENNLGEIKKFRVTKIADGKLTLDGNHPLAGQTITYIITVVLVRDARPEELGNEVSSGPMLH